MAGWDFQLVDAPHVSGGGVRGILTTARNRQVQLSKDGSSTCSWAMNYYEPGQSYRSHDVQLLVPKATDVVAWRDDKIKFRGRVTTHAVDYTENGVVGVTCSATSYKDMLDHRFLLTADCDHVTNSDDSPGPYQRNYTASADLGSIVWDLISLVQARTYGTLGILASTEGLSSTSPTAMTKQHTELIPTTPTKLGYTWTGGSGNLGHTAGHIVEFTVGQSIKNCIDKIATGSTASVDFGAGPIDATGFEWDIIPDQVTGQLRLHMWSKANGSYGRGAITNYLLDYGGAVASGATQNAYLDTFSNYVRVSVGSNFIERKLGGGTAADGLWERMVTLPIPPPPPGAPSYNVVTRTMEGYAADAYEFNSKIVPAYTVNMRAGAWQELDGPVLGDTVMMQVPNLEGLSSDQQRVVGVTFTISDNGTEIVGVVVGIPTLYSVGASARRQKQLSDRFLNYERTYFGGTY